MKEKKEEEEGWNTGKGAGRVPRIGKGKGNVRLGEEHDDAFAHRNGNCIAVCKGGGGVRYYK